MAMRVLVRRVLQGLFLALVASTSLLIVPQYLGWNLERDRAAYETKLYTLKPGHDEEKIETLFRNVANYNKPYTIGIVRVTDHTPFFGGASYRVYDIGFYDFDRRINYLAHVTCASERIIRFDIVTTDGLYALAGKDY
ncbi:MAG: hypothetical protein HOH43_03010 [Candidatus Latescibacteria bacterium]|jgi:hypothetical protein|nr:hypothetical protein [Candidatus Latescibacterota bacterium]